MLQNPRLLRFARRHSGALTNNGEHIFAANHALRFFGSNAIYSYIPKNACSTMRLSLAIANGCIETVSDVNWIHNNNSTFRASLSELATASYTFVILRDPFSRLASLFLDKFVSKSPPAWAFDNATARAHDLDRLTFGAFVASLGRAGVITKDEHWRPQSHFCVYEQYDDYFSLEDFAAAQGVIERRTDMRIVDARSLTRHGLDRFEILPSAEDHAGAAVRDIAALMHRGQCPHPKSLYDSASVAAVTRLYADDISLYETRIGSPLWF